MRGLVLLVAVVAALVIFAREAECRALDSDSEEYETDEHYETEEDDKTEEESKEKESPKKNSIEIEYSTKTHTITDASASAREEEAIATELVAADSFTETISTTDASATDASAADEYVTAPAPEILALPTFSCGPHKKRARDGLCHQVLHTESIGEPREPVQPELPSPDVPLVDQRSSRISTTGAA